MPSKKKRYNARFPPARIKKIMQLDDDVGKVAAAVPVIISRVLELFIESLITKSGEMTLSRNARTLSTSHIKQTILSEKKFDFLKELVESIPDVSPTDEDGDTGGEPSVSSIPEPLRANSSEGKTKPCRLSSTEVKVKPASNASGAVLKVTRPRGRPRKIRPEELIESKVADETKEPKKRGRKKKLILMVPAPLSESETTDDAEEEMDEEDVSEEDSRVPNASGNHYEKPSDMTSTPVGKLSESLYAMSGEPKELRANNNNDVPHVSDTGVERSTFRLDRIPVQFVSASQPEKRLDECDDDASAGLPLDLKVFQPTYNIDNQSVMRPCRFEAEGGLHHLDRSRESGGPAHKQSKVSYSGPSEHDQFRPWVDPMLNKDTVSSLQGYSNGSRDGYFGPSSHGLEQLYSPPMNSPIRLPEGSPYCLSLRLPHGQPQTDHPIEQSPSGNHFVNPGMTSCLSAPLGNNGLQYNMTAAQLSASHARSMSLEGAGMQTGRMQMLRDDGNERFLRNPPPLSINVVMRPPLAPTGGDVIRPRISIAQSSPEASVSMAAASQLSDLTRSTVTVVQTSVGSTTAVRATLRSPTDTSSFVRSATTSGPGLATHRMPHIPTAFYSMPFARSLSSPQPSSVHNSPFRHATLQAPSSSSTVPSTLIPARETPSSDKVYDS